MAQIYGCHATHPETMFVPMTSTMQSHIQASHARQSRFKLRKNKSTEYSQLIKDIISLIIQVIAIQYLTKLDIQYLVKDWHG